LFFFVFFACRVRNARGARDKTVEFFTLTNILQSLTFSIDLLWQSLDCWGCFRMKVMSSASPSQFLIVESKYFSLSIIIQEVMQHFHTVTFG
jgi:hypothetical protein